MKLRETISWLMGTLQKNLFPYLEECSGTPLTEKQKQLIQILEIVQVERSVPKTATQQWMGRKVLEREAIAGREKPVPKPKKEKAAPRKRGRPGRGERREPKPESRLVRQMIQEAQESLQEIPVGCDVGAKKNAQGYLETWVGFKFHADVNDCGFPVSVVLTSASVHDSQVAIPLMKMTSSKVDYLYDLMDSAYDAQPIYEVSRGLGHVPLIDKNPRGKEVLPMAPHEAIRYNERTVSERFNSRLKEEFGGKNVRVRGYEKVKLHLMFGVMALFADHLIKLVG